MWKDIDFEGFENFKDLYAIDEHGNVFSKRTNRILKPSLNNKGYLYVVLYDKYFAKHLFLHRGVALAFLPNPNNYPIVMHKDNNRANPNINNLKWGTQKENMMQCSAENRCNTEKTRFNMVKWFEVYDDDNNILLQERSARLLSEKVELTEESVYAAVFNQSRLRFGKYKSCRIRSKETIKPFTININ